MDLPFTIDLRGKTAVITGAGGVLCSMFAKALAACGANVALLGRHYANVKKIEDEITACGGTARAYEADVLVSDIVESAAAQVKADFGLCNILINGAGGNNPRAQTDKEYFAPEDIEAGVTSFFDLDPGDISQVFNLNFLGVLITTQHFARQMGVGDVIINVSSMNAYTPLTKIPAYSAAKASVSNFTQWLAVHFSKAGVRVNAIAPGFFVTSQNKDLLFDSRGAPTSRTEKILAATPMDRFGKPEELIGALLFLVDSKAASFVTGVILPVDGGFSAYSGV